MAHVAARHKHVSWAVLVASLIGAAYTALRGSMLEGLIIGVVLLVLSGLSAIFFGGPRVRAIAYRVFPQAWRFLGYAPPAHALPVPVPDSVPSDQAEVWLSEVEEWRRHTGKLWRELKSLFQTLGMGGSGGPPNALELQVDNADWPLTGADLPATALTDFVQRLYPAHQDRIEKHRFEMSVLIERWATRIKQESGSTFSDWLRERLGPLHYRTVKLLRYVEAEKAKSIQNPSPDYDPLYMVGKVLGPQQTERGGLIAQRLPKRGRNES